MMIVDRHTQTTYMSAHTTTAFVHTRYNTASLSVVQLDSGGVNSLSQIHWAPCFPQAILGVLFPTTHYMKYSHGSSSRRSPLLFLAKKSLGGANQSEDPALQNRNAYQLQYILQTIFGRPGMSNRVTRINHLLHRPSRCLHHPPSCHPREFLETPRTPHQAREGQCPPAPAKRSTHPRLLGSSHP